MDVNAHDGGRYLTELREAVAFTVELGLTTRRCFEPGASIVGEEFCSIVREWTRINVCSRPEHEITGRCLRISVELTEFLAGAGVPVMFTLGWMSYRDEPLFRFNRDDVRVWLEHGLPNRDRLDMHAWVTLGSGEIIDASWLSTIGIVRRRPELVGAVIVSAADHVGEHRYHPIVIDTLIVERLQLAGLAQDAMQVLQVARV
jgi:hypothetical protein